MADPTSIAHYRITGKLGEGGMGAVYRAVDTRLGREVAIKVLTDAMANDAAFVNRFEREAQILALLNHPHIAVLHSIEDRALIMELVDGEELPVHLPLDTALDYARQIAEALEAAHEKGVIHRDLKPANIKVTPDGDVKVLDFGLAKTAEKKSFAYTPNSPTQTIGTTQAGIIMGTAGYMAPEQVSGKPVDKRADVWAFGVVLYEMLTGSRLFNGETVADTLADVLRADIDLNKLPATTPPAIRTLLKRCLDRNPKTRLRDIGEARIILSEPPEPPAPEPAKPKQRRWIPVVTTIAAAVAIIQFAANYFLKPATVPTLAARFVLPFPEGTHETNTFGGPSFVPSPDGRQIAFVAADGRTGTFYLWVRPVNGVAAQRLEKTEGANFPFWSPDSQHIGFFAEQALRRIALAGGNVQTICEFPGQIVNRSNGGATWNQDGVVLYTLQDKLMQAPASGGAASVAAEPNRSIKETRCIWPQFLPDGKHYLYHSVNDDPVQSAIYVGELGSAKRTLVLRTFTRAAYAPPGFLLFTREGALVAQRFNANSLKLSGEPVVVAPGVTAFPSNGRAAFAVSANGVLVYRAGGNGDEPMRQLAWYDRQGNRLQTVGKLAPNRRIYLSPNGKFVSVSRAEKGAYHTWVLDLDTGGFTRATFDARESSYGSIWAPDSERLLYSRRAGGLVELNWRSGAVQEITADQELPGAEAYSPDGRFLIVNVPGQNKTWLLPLHGERKLQPVLQGEYARNSFRISPDGRKVAWAATEGSRPEVYIADFPTFANKRQVSTDGGSHPEWNPKGQELFYRSDKQLMAADLRTLRSSVLFPVSMAELGPQYAVSPDGQRFLINEALREAEDSPIVVALHWQPVNESR